MQQEASARRWPQISDEQNRSGEGRIRQEHGNNGKPWSWILQIRLVKLQHRWAPPDTSDPREFAHVRLRLHWNQMVELWCINLIAFSLRQCGNAGAAWEKCESGTADTGGSHTVAPHLNCSASQLGSKLKRKREIQRGADAAKLNEICYFKRRGETFFCTPRGRGSMRFITSAAFCGWRAWD